MGRKRHTAGVSILPLNILYCRDERLTVSVGSHPVSRGVLVDGPTLLVSLLADAPKSEEPTVVRTRSGTFTSEEDALVLRPDLTARQAAGLLGRTAASVARRRKRLRA